MLGYCTIVENPGIYVTINEDGTLTIDYSDDVDYYTFHCVSQNRKSLMVIKGAEASFFLTILQDAMNVLIICLNNCLVTCKLRWYNRNNVSLRKGEVMEITEQINTIKTREECRDFSPLLCTCQKFRRLQIT